MLFLLSRRLPSSYPVLAIIATNLVISMPAPPSKRSPVESYDARNGFSSVPKILEIQLPLKIASKDDLVAWAKYVMGLMASKINITLTTVKEPPPKSSGNGRAPDTIRDFDDAKQAQYPRNPALKIFDDVRPRLNGIRQFANVNSFENARYAENVRNLGHRMNFDSTKVPATVRILENARHLENARSPLRSGNTQMPADKQYAVPHLPTIAISGVTTRNVFNNHQLQPIFSSLGITDATLPNPLEITANINVPRARNNEPIFKGPFDATSSLKVADQQLFVPHLPEIGPVIDLKISDIFRNTNVASPPTRTYLPVTTTTDNIRFPTDPFVTRYFFDGVERNISSNFGVHATDVTQTTMNPLMFSDEIPLPVKSTELLSQQRNGSSMRPIFNVPFEAVITFNHGGSVETTTLRNDKNQYVASASRDQFPEQFPPYFDSNYTQTNESGQINVVFDDNAGAAPKNSTRKEERKKQEKKKESSKKQKSKKQKTSTRLQSPITQFLKTFMGLRRNNTPSVDLSPPPLNQELTTQRVPARQGIPQAQRAPQVQRVPPPQRQQQYYPPRNPPSALRQGRRNQTSLAQALEDDDDSGSKENSSSEDSGGKEDSGSKENSNGNEKSNSDESEGGGDSNGDAETEGESNDGGSSESSSSESEEDSEEEGGSIKAVIDLLQLAGPILEDLSDPESDTTIGEVLETAIPLLQDLSEGDDETEGLDIPGLLVPVLLQISGGMDGMGDSAAILTPIIQLIAPLSGPLSGPLLVPLSRQSSNRPGQGGSSSGDILKASLDPLLQPVGPGMMTALSNLVAGVISSLSKSSGGKSDITSLVKAIVAGSVAGTSAGSSNNRDSYGAPTSNGGDYGYGPPPRPPPPPHRYGQRSTPPANQNPLAVLGTSVNDILNAIVKVVASLVSAITGILGASSNSSNEPQPTYGPSRPTYGPPRSPYGPPRSPYGPPRSTSGPPRSTSGPPRQSFTVPSSDSISITTSKPERLSRF